MARIVSYILGAEGKYIIPHWAEKPKELVYAAKKKQEISTKKEASSPIGFLSLACHFFLRLG